MVDFLDALRSESARFSTLARTTDMDARVPCCPDWRFTDLVWHLSEVQSFWASIVEDLVTDPETVRTPDRPADGDLPSFFEAQSARLVAALERQDPDAECWSWAEDGHSVGWVRRRQAHEALIHRVDSEQTAGDRTPIEPELAADGVDEVLRVQMDAGTPPAWARFEPSGARAVIHLVDRTGSWAFEIGRFLGTSPVTGTSYDLPAIRLLPDTPAEPAVTLRGAAADLDLWLWGRGPLEPIEIEGQRAVAESIREVARDATG